MEEQFGSEAKEGWRSAADAARMKEQAVRIERMHQEEFLLHSTVTWKCLLCVQKKEQLSRFQEMKE